MKIEVAKNDLDFALNTTRTAVGNGTDITSHYLFRIHNKKMEVLSQNLRVFSGAPVICNFEGEEGDAFTVESWRLDKWLSGASDGVLTLTYNGNGDVQAKSGRSSIRLRSLDASKFPFWDKLISSATTVGTIAPEKITRALNLTKNFVSTDDTLKPELCQVESIDGTFWATDRKGVCSAKVPMGDLNIRIPAKDITPVTKFLGNEDSVEVLTSSREEDSGSCVLFKKETGHYLGVTKPVTQFPTLALDPDKIPDCTVSLDMDELTAGLAVLSASAPKGYESVTFRWDKENQKVVLSMPSVAGGNDEYPLSLAGLTVHSKEFETFTIDYPYLKGIVNAFGLDKIDLGVNSMGRAGFTSFKYEEQVEEGNSYYAVIVWRT